MDPISIVLFGAAALLIFFQFSQSKKRKQSQEALQASIVVGTRVMTFSGIVGDIVAIEDDIISLKTGTAVIELKKGAVREVLAAAAAPAAKKPAAKKPAAKKTAAK